MANVVEKSTIVRSVPEVSLFIPNLPDVLVINYQASHEVILSISHL